MYLHMHGVKQAVHVFCDTTFCRNIFILPLFPAEKLLHNATTSSCMSKCPLSQRCTAIAKGHGFYFCSSFAIH